MGVEIHHQHEYAPNSTFLNNQGFAILSMREIHFPLQPMGEYNLKFMKEKKKKKKKKQKTELIRWFEVTW